MKTSSEGSGMATEAKSSRLSGGASPSASAHVIALSELSNVPEGEAIVESSNPLHHVKAKLRVCVGEVTVTVGELLALKQAQVITLEQTLEHPVELLLEGRVVARGQLVAVDEHFAVRVTELPVALKP